MLAHMLLTLHVGFTEHFLNGTFHQNQLKFNNEEPRACWGAWTPSPLRRHRPLTGAQSLPLRLARSQCRELSRVGGPGSGQAPRSRALVALKGKEVKKHKAGGS